MGIRLEWDNDEKTIMRHIYEGEWTLEDYYTLLDENYSHIDEVGHKVYIINDLRAMTGMPSNVAVAVRRAALKTHANEALNIMVGANSYVTLLVETVYRVAGNNTKRLRHTVTLDEAYTIIAADMKTTPNQEELPQNGHSD